jgi:hypothetical protein
MRVLCLAAICALASAALPECHNAKAPLSAQSLAQINPMEKVQQAASDFRKSRFNKIYATNYWGQGDRGGQGDHQGEIVEDKPAGGGDWSLVIEDKLCEVIHSQVAKQIGSDTKKPISIFDGPSGDFHWMGPCLTSLAQKHPKNEITYHGFDIASEIVDKLNDKNSTINFKKEIAKHKNIKSVSFRQLDLADEKAVAEATKDMKFDIALCMHALMHNSNAGAKSILKNLNGIGGAKFLVVNDYHPQGEAKVAEQGASSIRALQLRSKRNWDILPGMHRDLDLHKDPFGLGNDVLCSTPVPTREGEEAFEVLKMPYKLQ